MLVRCLYDQDMIGQAQSTISYDLHDDFSIGTEFCACTKLLWRAYNLWWFVKTYRDLQIVSKTCRTPSLYIVHDWPRLTGFWWSYHGHICSQIQCDWGLSSIVSHIYSDYFHFKTIFWPILTFSSRLHCFTC